jgi:hypothetical protein
MGDDECHQDKNNEWWKEVYEEMLELFNYYDQLNKDRNDYTDSLQNLDKTVNDPSASADEVSQAYADAYVAGMNVDLDEKRVDSWTKLVCEHYEEVTEGQDMFGPMCE